LILYSHLDPGWQLTFDTYYTGRAVNTWLANHNVSKIYEEAVKALKSNEFRKYTI